MSAGQDPVAMARLMANDEVRRKLQMDQVRRSLAPGKTEDQGLKEACEGFESIFLNKLWQQMRKTVDKDGYLHSKEEESYVGMFDQEMSIKLAQSGGMGLGQQLYEQLKQRLTQAGAATPSAFRMAASSEAPADVTPLHPDPASRGLRLRPDPAELDQPSRPASDAAALSDPGPRDQVVAMAAELARRIVEEHRAGEGGDAVPTGDME